MKRQSLLFKAPFEIDIVEEELPEPAAAEVLIQTRFSAVSHGTEMLVYRGLFPVDTAVDETIPELRRPLRYPLKYGYAAVGEIIDAGNDVNPDPVGQTVFCLHPHETCFTAGAHEIIPVPKPVIGEKVAVYGQGVVGLLTTSLLAHFPLAALLTLDPFKLRRDASRQAGAHRALDPTLPETESQISMIFESDGSKGLADLTYELSGNSEALNQAIAVTGFDGRIVVGSCYGSKPAALDLGSRFHRRRLRLISSQVSTLTPDLAARWSRKRRFDVAWDMIRRIRPASLITREIPFTKAREAYELIDKDPATTVQVVLEHERSG
jgi:threonine dehydrogenase-like Zn-dependent dehydrogenase